jgi:hypothetical protein
MHPLLKGDSGETRLQRGQGEDGTMAEAPPRHCGHCGQELSPEDQFCRNCGTPVQQPARGTTPETAVPEGPPPPSTQGA